MRVAIYARVSTDRGDQNPKVQVHALERWIEALGHTVVRVYVDHISGAKRERPALDDLLQDAPRIADAVAVVKIDRLARSTRDLIDITGILEAGGVDLLVKDQQVDTSTPAGKMLFVILGAIAEFERDLIVERTMAGLDHARRSGVILGRPRGSGPRDDRVTIDVAVAKRLVRELGSISAAARKLGVPRRTLSDAVRAA